jgi:hypothetical protein
MKKNGFILAFAGMLLFAATACNSTKNVSGSSDSTTVDTSTVTSPPVVDTTKTDTSRTTPPDTTKTPPM